MENTTWADGRYEFDMDGRYRASKDNIEKQGTDEHLPVDTDRVENTTWTFGECEFDKDGK